MDGVPGSIHDLVRRGANTRHRFALITNGLEQPPPTVRGMRPPRFTETARQNFGGCFKKKHRNFESGAAQGPQLLGKGRKKPALAEANYQRRALNVAFFFSFSLDQPRKPC